MRLHISAALITFMPALVAAQVEYCNRSSSTPIWVDTKYAKGSSGSTFGHLKLDSGQCKRSLSLQFLDSLAVYGTDNSGKIWQGSGVNAVSQCINKYGTYEIKFTRCEFDWPPPPEETWTEVQFAKILPSEAIGPSIRISFSDGYFDIVRPIPPITNAARSVRGNPASPASKAGATSEPPKSTRSPSTAPAGPQCFPSVRCISVAALEPGKITYHNSCDRVVNIKVRGLCNGHLISSGNGGVQIPPNGNASINNVNPSECSALGFNTYTREITEACF